MHWLQWFQALTVLTGSSSRSAGRSFCRAFGMHVDQAHVGRVDKARLERSSSKLDLVVAVAAQVDCSMAQGCGLLGLLDCWLQAAGCRLHAVGRRLWSAVCIDNRHWLVGGLKAGIDSSELLSAARLGGVRRHDLIACRLGG